MTIEQILAAAIEADDIAVIALCHVALDLPIPEGVSERIPEACNRYEYNGAAWARAELGRSEGWVCDCGATPDPSESFGARTYEEDGKTKFMCLTCWARECAIWQDTLDAPLGVVILGN